MAYTTIFEIDLVRLSVWHRRCSVAAVLIILYWVTFIIVAANGYAVPGFEVISLFFYGLTMVATLVLTYATHRAMGHGVFTCIIWTIAALFLSFLVLLSTASTAGMILRLAGAKVSTLGVSQDDRDRLRPKHCRSCGYSREGIELLSPCPECTAVPRVI